MKEAGYFLIYNMLFIKIQNVVYLLTKKSIFYIQRAHCHLIGEELMRNSSRMVNSLDAEALHFFSLISCFNGHFSIDWLVGILRKKASEILLLLEDGVRKGWLAKKDGGIFYFKDLNIREELGNKVPPLEKEQAHRKIVEYFIEEVPDDDEKILLLSCHLQKIKCNGEFCKLLLEAGDIYLKSFRTEEALQCYSKILDELSCVEDAENDEIFMKAAIRYSKNTTAPLHNCLTIVSVLEEALIRASNHRKENYQALLYMHLAKNEWLCSQYKEALEHFDQGWALAAKLDQHTILRSAQTFAIYFSLWKGNYLEGIRNYEKFVPDVQVYPEGRFPLLATLLVGYCYAQIGQITQGLGMLDAIYAQCQKKGDSFMSTYAQLSIGGIMLNMGKTEEALELMEPWVNRAREEHNDWAWIGGELGLAFGYYRRRDFERSTAHLQEFLKASKQVQINDRFYPYLFDLCFAIHNGELPPVAGLSLEKEIKESITGKNVFLKGVAYRYTALLQKQEGAPAEKIIQSLLDSISFIAESGHQLELARSQFELARQYALSGNKEGAKEMALAGSKILSFLNEELIPDDIRNITQHILRTEGPLHEILKMSQEIMTIRDNNELVQNIISRVNKITGAERGAIFLLEDNSSPLRFHLRASKNLTSEQVNEPAFNSSREMIREAVEKRKGIVQETDSAGQEGLKDDNILSRICVPMILRNKVVGILYNDNRLIKSAFREANLNVLAYFASQAAIALDNAISYEEIQSLNRKLREENLYYVEQQVRSHHFEDIIGESDAIEDVLKKIEQVAKTDSTVLILGETGVGKEMVARAIHRYSPRQDKSFISVFCNALPDTLLPSELFGHERGAFTGATNRRVGRFELADGGTLFLDEIGDLPLDIQIRLLRVLQSKEFERVGGSDSIFSDFRLIAATNHDLEKEVSAKKFRSDLYYRINVFPILVPPLRERRGDIPLLSKHFLKSYASKMGKSFSGISKEDMNRLIQYDWLGNIRELENIIERGVILSDSPTFRVPELDNKPPLMSTQDKDNATLKEIEYRHILNSLQKSGWKIRGRGGAAELLDIHPSTLDFRMKKLGIQKPRK